MINDARIDFQLIRDSILEDLQGELIPRHDPYKKLISALSALNQCSEEFSIVIQVTSGSHPSAAGQPSKHGAIIKQGLTRRELEVYALAMRGLSNRLIAEKLFITIETVKSHRKSIVRKAGVRRIEDIKDLLLEINRLI